MGLLEFVIEYRRKVRVHAQDDAMDVKDTFLAKNGEV
jgi:hypothetical protein